MPIFLTRNQVYRILQRELPPEDVYPDGPPTAFFSTSDNDSTAAVVAQAYSNLERIYENYFPQSADERQVDWELRTFGYELSGNLTLQERRDRVLARIRQQRRTTPGDIKAEVYTVIDSSVSVEIVEWGCGDAGWILDVSELEISTILNGYHRLNPTGPNLCSLDAAGFGLTEEEYLEMREEAYTYEVRIYSYTLTSDEAAALEKVLLDAEPVRSRHFVFDGLDPADMIDGDG